MRLTGHTLPGVDEFMLRLGHLAVVCHVATVSGGTGSRLSRAVGEALTNPVEVPENASRYVASYLANKRLCEVAGEQSGVDPNRLRYPDLIVQREAGGDTLRSRVSEAPRIWWQDFFLSDPRLPSHVGAITVAARSGSKTGASHIIDWAEKLSLISTSGDASLIGRVLADTPERDRESPWSDNPYLIETRRTIYAYLVFASDFDVASRLLAGIASSAGLLRKAEAARLFVETVISLAEEAEEARYLSARQQFSIAEHLRELRRAARRTKRDDVDEITSLAGSTAWHRASSRFETYVDLGLLTKGTKQNHKYEYVYTPSDALFRVVRSFTDAEDDVDWLERRLVAAITGKSGTVSFSEFVTSLQAVASEMVVTSGEYPLDALTLGLATHLQRQGTFVELGVLRDLVADLGRRAPQIVRLSRGMSGERAEFASLSVRELSQYSGHD